MSPAKIMRSGVTFFGVPGLEPQRNKNRAADISLNSDSIRTDFHAVRNTVAVLVLKPVNSHTSY